MPSACRSAPTQLRAGQEDHAGVVAGAQQRLDERLGVDDAGLGRPERGDRACTAARARAMNARSTISRPSTPLSTPRRCSASSCGISSLVVRDDQLAAARVRHAVRGAELVEQPPAFDAEPRLQRAGRIVDAGVDHAAVVRAGVQARARVPLEDADRLAARRERPRGGQAGHAGADDRDVNLGQRVSPVERVSPVNALQQFELVNRPEQFVRHATLPQANDTRAIRRQGDVDDGVRVIHEESSSEVRQHRPAEKRSGPGGFDGLDRQLTRVVAEAPLGGLHSHVPDVPRPVELDLDPFARRSAGRRSATGCLDCRRTAAEACRANATHAPASRSAEPGARRCHRAHRSASVNTMVWPKSCRRYCRDRRRARESGPFPLRDCRTRRREPPHSDAKRRERTRPRSWMIRVGKRPGRGRTATGQQRRM